MSMVEGSWARDEGLPLPLGVTSVPEQRAYNFAIYSKHAERVVLQTFRADDLAEPAYQLDLDYLQHKTGRVWHRRVTERELAGSRYYAYRIDGPPRRLGIHGIPSSRTNCCSIRTPMRSTFLRASTSLRQCDPVPTWDARHSG